MAYIVAERPQQYDPTNYRIGMVDSHTGTLFTPLEVRVADVRFKKTKEEIDARRRLYRQKYLKRPYVQEKDRKKREDPIVKAKKKQYADKPQVKERKKELSKANRAIPAKLKEKAPLLYKEIIGEVRGALSTTCLTGDISCTFEKRTQHGEVQHPESTEPVPGLSQD